VVPMERASVATDGDSRTAMDGAKCPLEWVPQGRTEQLRTNVSLNFALRQCKTLYYFLMSHSIICFSNTIADIYQLEGGTR